MDCQKSKRVNFPKISSIVGSFLLLLPGRPILYWGNLSVYVLSYIIVRYNPDPGIQPVWLSAMYSVFWSIGMVVNGWAADIIGKRFVIAIGMAVFNLCIYLSSFYIRFSTTTFILVYGAFTGLGNGLGEGLLFKNYVVPWSTDDTGCLTSIVISAAEFGAVAMDQFVTLYVNPDNESANAKKGELDVFSQADILDRVPSLFIIQGAMTSLIQIIGFCFIRENKALKTQSNSCAISHEKQQTSDNSTVLPEQSEKSRILAVQREPASPTPSASVTTNGRIIPPLTGMSPVEMLKTPMFYFLWIAYFSSTTSRTIINTYYKIYGQTEIHNDHFLTNLGTTITALAAVITLMWGLIMDRVRMKTVHIVIQTILVVTNAFLYFAPALGDWVYFITCCLGVTALAPLYMCFTVSIIILFGRDQLSLKMTIAGTAPLASSLAAGPVSEIILPHLGWFALFMWPGILAASSLILVVCVFPET